MFMRYCGGGPGYFGVPTCSTAWRIGIDTENSTPTPSLPNSNDVGQLSDDSGEETGTDYVPDLEEDEFMGHGNALF